MGTLSLELEGLSEDERRALRVSKFSSLGGSSTPTSTRASGQKFQAAPRLAHPGGSITTNKAAALSRFLQRKLATPGGAALDPDLVQKAVENAKATISSSEAGGSARIRHVESFDNESGGFNDSWQKDASKAPNGKKNKKKKKQQQQQFHAWKENTKSKKSKHK
eukprot:TRINITY_DN2838_c0_g1_i1.p1 TRINITY_DN2838_c0_g1~~TRINITY_DN2838_c0_g1_i1.p1  ORF type:complete len:164 (-),score=34.60 TRINITY_DN2838_c0_g1_i1:187-678(-)